jgi:mono/diheme cytochrome c family protein
MSVIMLCPVVTSFSQAQTTRALWDGVFTDAQADRGAGEYVQHCAVCHGAALEGNGEAPPLTGQFVADWAGTTLADLNDKIRDTMPLNAPGTLRPTIAADILAFVLKANGAPAGSNELSPAQDSLKIIRFELLKPRPFNAQSDAKPTLK